MEREKNAFTLIELLAVIVILGILIGIAIPKVTKYITNTKIQSFIDESIIFIGTVKKDIEGELIKKPMSTTDVTIVTFDVANLDKAKPKSPFGGKYVFNKSYVAVINVGTGVNPVYKYYVAAQDSKGYAIPLTLESKLDTSKIVTNAKNKMEVTVQSLCGSREGYTREFSEISGLSDVQPVDKNGNKISWNVTIYSSEECNGQ